VQCSAQVGRQLGDAASDVSIHTLHALGRRVIDTWASRLGFDDRPTVLHQDGARSSTQPPPTLAGTPTLSPSPNWALNWALLELLAAEHHNLVVVGDPVQMRVGIWACPRPGDELLAENNWTTKEAVCADA
jgi:hypothetical protein